MFAFFKGEEWERELRFQIAYEYTPKQCYLSGDTAKLVIVPQVAIAGHLLLIACQFKQCAGSDVLWVTV